VPAARAFVEAMLGLQVWANTVHRQVTAGSHAHFAERDHH
jgi:urease beta subunit